MTQPLRAQQTAQDTEAERPCDPERLKTLEGAVREAVAAYLHFTDPHFE
jgi:hypothetical protein